MLKTLHPFQEFSYEFRPVGIRKSLTERIEAGRQRSTRDHRLPRIGVHGERFDAAGTSLKDPPGFAFHNAKALS